MIQLRRLTLLLVIISSGVLAQNDCIDNCWYCQSSNSCAICDTNYETDVYGMCVQGTIEGCLYYGAQQECYGCYATYYLQNSQCFKMNNGCLSGNAQQCTECGYGTILNNGRCQGTINCASDQQPCQSCRPGFTLSGGICRTSAESGCDEVDPRTGACIKCGDGYFLSQFRCYEDSCYDPRCYYRLDEDNCQFCKNGFVILSGVCLTVDEFQMVQNGQKTVQDFRFECDSSGTPDNSGGSTGIALCQVIDPSDASRCLLCEYGFYWKGNSCVPVSKFCNGFNPQSRQCFACKFQLTFSNGKCSDDNCQNSFEDQCQNCKSGYQLDEEGVCRQGIPNCLDYSNGRCLDCDTGYYISANDGQCYPLPPNCAIANPLNGDCLQCNDGYSFQTPGQPCEEEQVFVAPTPTNPITPSTPTNPTNPSVPSFLSPDINCLEHNGMICLQCSNRYYVSPGSGRCIPVNPLCKDHNSIGQCTDCYQGFTTFDGKCIVAQTVDPNCKQRNGQGCSECYSGYFYNSEEAICKRVNPLCKTYNETNGACKSCFQGYVVNEQRGTCQVFIKDPNCLEYNGDNCIQCSNKFYLNNNKCIPVNPLCKDYNRTNGFCTQCYQGYSLDSGKCSVGGKKQSNCQQASGNICLVCFNGFYTKNGECEPANPLCKTYDPNTGNCTTCYPGYKRFGGVCQIDKEKDENCKKFDENKQNYCLQCYPGYHPINGKCQEKDPLCKTYNNITGGCASCWPGYTLSRDQCIIVATPSSASVAAGGDPYCTENNGNLCVSCVDGYYVNQQENKCKQLDPICKDHNRSTGACTDCYNGYTLDNFRCVVKAIAQVPNCVDTNAAGRCTECFQGYYQKDGSCQAVSLLCLDYNRRTGACTSCINTYFFQDGGCIYPALPDQNCIHYTNSFCDSCVSGYYVENFLCSEVDENCLSFNYEEKRCNACRGGLTAQGPNCI